MPSTTSGSSKLREGCFFSHKKAELSYSEERGTLNPLPKLQSPSRHPRYVLFHLLHRQSDYERRGFGCSK